MKTLLKKIYSAVPFKQQFFGVLKPLSLPSSVYKYLRFQGVFKVQVGDKSFKIMHHGYPVENELFWEGLKKWESVSLKIWMDMSKRSKVIIDVGANTGIYSLIASTLNPSAQVYSFEPLNFVYQKLLYNLSLNPSLNIKAFDIALSNNNGQTFFNVPGDIHSYTASLNKSHDVNNAKQVPVETKTLDTFLTEQSSEVHLIKIDVERHEPEVIEGFMSSIKKFLPTILIEVLDDDIASRLNKQFESTPYFFFNLNEITGEIKKMPRLNRSNDFNILICTPKVAAELGLE
jgi:FkbM family methyltransferase